MSDTRENGADVVAGDYRPDFVYRRDATWRRSSGRAFAYHSPRPSNPALAACGLLVLHEGTGIQIGRAHV